MTPDRATIWTFCITGEIGQAYRYLVLVQTCCSIQVTWLSNVSQGLHVLNKHILEVVLQRLRPVAFEALGLQCLGRGEAFPRYDAAGRSVTGL